MIELLIQLFSQRFLLFALHFEGGGKFPKPLSAKEERECFEKMAQGDPAAHSARNGETARYLALLLFSDREKSSAKASRRYGNAMLKSA